MTTQKQLIHFDQDAVEKACSVRGDALLSLHGFIAIPGHGR